MSKVIVKKADYEYDRLKPLVFEIMDTLGGSEKIKKNRPVLIKPNLLTTAKPGDAVLTHCLLVKAVVEYTLSKGALPQVSDSPALGAFSRILKEGGFKEALKGLDVVCKEFRESRPVDVGAPFGLIDLAREALEAEIIINLPKLKTHAHMLLTLGVKNMFGCVVGLRKPEWHMRIGANREMFARLLVQIHQRVKPAITIIDGILAMEGEGPRKRGTPRRLDILLAGDDDFALDAVVCRMFGLEPDRIPTLRVAREMSLLEELPEVLGRLPLIRDFELPCQLPIALGPPQLQAFMRRFALQRPVCERTLCKVCGKCWEFCPAGAIGQAGGEISFDYEKCIRCYCCIEVCPYGAVHAVEPPVGKLVRRIIRAKDP